MVISRNEKFRKFLDAKFQTAQHAEHIEVSLGMQHSTYLRSNFANHEEPIRGMATSEVWPLRENMCLLHAMYFGLSETEKELFTCGGLYEPRALLRSVIPRTGRSLLRGVTSIDAHNLIKKIVENNSLLGRNVKYTWQRQGQNVRSGHGWKVTDLKKTVLSKVGKFVVFGKAKRNSDKHNNFIAKLRKLDNDDEVVAEWAKVADGSSAHDHGVGIIVAEDKTARIIDNGCTHGSKLFTMINLADRLDDVTTCYKFELYEV